MASMTSLLRRIAGVIPKLSSWWLRRSAKRLPSWPMQDIMIRMTSAVVACSRISGILCHRRAPSSTVSTRAPREVWCGRRNPEAPRK